jgi:hypothetical protein
LKSRKRAASARGKPRLAFYSEDIDALNSILRRLAATHGLDACVVYSARHGVLLAEHGEVPPRLLRDKRSGLSLGWGLRLSGVQGDRIAVIPPADGIEAIELLQRIAARRESGKRITREFGRPLPPRRA